MNSRKRKTPFSILCRFSLILISAVILIADVSAETIIFEDNWGEQGFNLISQNSNGVEVVFSIQRMEIEDFYIKGEAFKTVHMPGVFLPNEAGAPDLPGTGRYIAFPQGASVKISILEVQTVVYEGLNIAPAPVIPFENDDSPLVYEKDLSIYQNDAYYPENPVMLSQPLQIRGVDVVILGITPFQYNPVTQQLIVYQNLRVQVDFAGGNGQFGEDRQRSRYWEPILQGHLLNYNSLPEVDFDRIPFETDEVNVEYLIIVPDDPVFIAWADTIKQWRNQQGIVTGITTLSEIGGNNADLIQYYLINAYYLWQPSLAAVLMLSDYQNSGDNYGITAPLWNNYCASDNIYADIFPDNLPDIAIGRITAQNETHLANMIGKMMEYERTPPTDPDFYQHPLMAGGWQDDRWFILCTEICYGFHNLTQNKEPVREYAICSGNPGSIWSTNSNTGLVVSYFGPNGLGYIPSSPSYLTNWNGSATGVNNAINNGAFLVLHRDHGYEAGWGEPGYSIANLYSLTNEMYPFVFSVNCLSGMYNNSSNCFAEVFHRMEHGALGLIAASQVSYSFVNDTYVWGMWDSMWPQFDPGYGIDSTGSANLRPGFANVSGKYYLQASNWPSSGNYKVHTYHLFHHHGDPFITLYSEVPQELTVTLPPVVFDSDTLITVTVDSGVMVALTVNNTIIGLGQSQGTPMDIAFEPQLPGSSILITATLQNYYRYMEWMEVVPQENQYVVFNALEIDDSTGNNNGVLDLGETVDLTITVKNVGMETAEDVTVEISSEDEYVTILDSNEFYGSIPAGECLAVADGFQIEAGPNVPNMHGIEFTLHASNSYSSWDSPFTIIAHAPQVCFNYLTINDSNGNNNANLDPGETVDFQITIVNQGSSDAANLTVELIAHEQLITIPNPVLIVDSISAGQSLDITYQDINAHPSMIQGAEVDFDLNISAENGYTDFDCFSILVGNELYQPYGPDGYGYYAYDMYDGFNAPLYEWLEIAPLAGGSGEDLGLNSNQTVQVELPFVFTYYGLDYDTVSVCANGWMCFGVTNSFIPVNLSMPNPLEPNSMVAGFWDSMILGASSQICAMYDIDNNRFIIEWYRVKHNMQPNAVETFQIILLDPQYYSTLTGDGEIILQYNTVSDFTEFCTVGIEDHEGAVGLEYLYMGDYAQYASPLESSFALKFSTDYYENTNTPYPFNLISPLAGDTCWTLSQGFVWHSTTDPDSGQIPAYDLWVDTLADLSTKWRAAELIPDTVFLAENLPDDNNVYWTVRAGDTNSPGAWAEDTLYIVTFYPEPPSEFELLSPQDSTMLAAWETLFDWTPSLDPDPNDPVEYTLWFVSGDDSIGYITDADSMLLHPDTVSVLTIGDEAVWYVTAHSSSPDTIIECNQRFTLTPTTGISEQETSEIPDDFCLYQNYPNPFNPVTSIKFGLPEEALVNIQVYDILGRRVDILANGELKAGYHILHWNAGEHSSGIYFIHMEAGDFQRTIKTLMVK